MASVNLYIPSDQELFYRGHLISDEATMAYNMGYGDDGGCTYHRTAEELQGWYQHWNVPDRFYAYVQRTGDLAFLGEVNLHRSKTKQWFEMGIVIEAKYRGMGYSLPALRLLLDHAFTKMNAGAVHNCFEAGRRAAERLHRKAGFVPVGQKDTVVEYLITKAQYEAGKPRD